ncbi:hypothetical protein MPER_07456 [Moniliophthora perniciosa FA553]|nr:hypothetical protein MPER_07456 [Moniliophthora perniciosa FA553]
MWTTNSSGGFRSGENGLSKAIWVGLQVPGQSAYHFLSATFSAHVEAALNSNHGTFYAYQLAGSQLATGDKQGARNTLTAFFEASFLDQIAASGEQPYEAVRTRPFHYRCFNLEGLIGLAKLGNEVGLDMWKRRTKQGATIQTALDFIIRTDPKDEDLDQVSSHVAAIRAAYGDPPGKYLAFLQKNSPNYTSKPSLVL